MSKDCTNTALYESLKYCKGKTILPGIKQRGYYAAKDDIATWPSLPAVASSAASELATYVGSFNMAADKTFHVIDFTQNKGSISWETQGDIPSRTFLNKATLNHPEIDETAAGVSREMLADDLVFVIPQRDGKYRVIGSEAFPTDTKPQGGTGEGTSGDVGTTLEIEATDVCPAPFYVGTLATDEGEVDCSGTAASTGD